MSIFEQFQIQASDSPSVDAFGRWRVSQPVTLFDSQFQYDLRTLWWEQTTAVGGTVTHLPNESAAQLAVSASAGSVSEVQTYQYFRYRPGKSHLVAMTFNFGAGVGTTTKDIGLLDTNNGIFLRQNGASGVQIVKRTYVSGSIVEFAIDQADWNKDKLNGSGPSVGNPSGITIDFTNAQILIIDLQWLGVGRVRVGFDIGGVLIYAHEFLHANILTTPYITTANLPLRVRVSNAGGTAATSMKLICTQVASEGGIESENGSYFSGGNDRTLKTSIGTGAYVHLCSFRAKALFNSIANRATIQFNHFHIYGASNPMLVRVIYNATLTGASWADVDASLSGVQIDTAATLSGGVVVDTVYVPVSGSGTNAVSEAIGELASRYPVCLDRAGNPRGVLSFSATSISGTAEAGAEANWTEFR